MLWPLRARRALEPETKGEMRWVKTVSGYRFALVSRSVSSWRQIISACMIGLEKGRREMVCAPGIHFPPLSRLLFVHDVMSSRMTSRRVA